MNTTENNKLIAEFMGARATVFRDGTKGHTFWNEEGVEGRSGSFPNGATNYFKYDEGYHTSWDWLMPVVEKIEENKGLTVHIIGRSTSILRNGNGQSEAFNKSSEYIKKNPIREFGNDKLEGCYKAVAEFIKLYNENKNN